MGFLVISHTTIGVCKVDSPMNFVLKINRGHTTVIKNLNLKFDGHRVENWCMQNRKPHEL